SFNASCQLASFGSKKPIFAVQAATINPVKEDKIATNSGPNNHAYNNADPVYKIPTMKVHGNIGHASLIVLFSPKNFVNITTIMNGINVPANKSIAVI